MAEVYRKAALERLSSPEQLDKLIKVTSPMSWLSYLGAVLIIIAAAVWAVLGRIPQTVDMSGICLSPDKSVSLVSPATGVIEYVTVSEGSEVSRGDSVATVVGADGAASEVWAARSGKISAVNCQSGDFVAYGEEVAKIAIPSGEAGAGLELVCYVPFVAGKNLSPGMSVTVAPANISEQEHGHMTGKIVSVSENAASTSDMLARLGNDLLVGVFQQQGPVLELSLSLDEDSGTASGFKWSNVNGGSVLLTPGTMVSAKAIVKSEAPIAKVFPFLRRQAAR
ncbi:MAG: HlyD family efflux transporter periplasmic adaptor subunit [Clostridiales bacterium]|jgi:predicted RecA/RadA family phage recombinase|nr:HlyD family efflux transporter periplasmic adaptor subunit [Clostridiales bacterium]